MRDLIIKSFNNHEVRAIDNNGEIWFVAVDIANALSYKNTRDAIRQHVDEEDKNTVAIYDGIGNPSKVIINESGMYSLVLRSKKPEAKSFKRWVTSEVLPSIRKTGSYRHTLSPEQQCEIQQLVNKQAYETGKTHQSIYRNLKDKFNVGIYKDILAKDFDNAVKFLGGEDTARQYTSSYNPDDFSVGDSINIKTFETKKSNLHKLFKGMYKNGYDVYPFVSELFFLINQINKQARSINELTIDAIDRCNDLKHPTNIEHMKPTIMFHTIGQ